MRRWLIRGGSAVVLPAILWFFAARWRAIFADQLYTPRLASRRDAPIG